MGTSTKAIARALGCAAAVIAVSAVAVLSCEAAEWAVSRSETGAPAELVNVPLCNASESFDDWWRCTRTVQGQ